MRYSLHLITRYPLSSLLIALIWYLCFLTPPQTGLEEVKNIDKWTHTAMYLVTCLTIWAEYLYKHSKTDWRKVILLAWAAPVAMSGIIEILQANCTGGRRSGEWLDFVANTIGATTALVIGILWAKYRAKG